MSKLIHGQKKILHDDVERNPDCPIMIVKLKMVIIMMMLVMTDDDDDSDDDDRHPVCPMMIVKLKMGDGLLVAARYDHRD